MGLYYSTYCTSQGDAKKKDLPKGCKIPDDQKPKPLKNAAKTAREAIK